MEEDGIDALVLSEGTNFYHASGHRPVTTRMGHRPTAVAIITRQQSQPLTLVLASFTYYFQLSDSLDADKYPIYLYTGPELEDGSKALPISVFPDRNEAPMDDIETRRASLTFLAEKERSAAPSGSAKPSILRPSARRSAKSSTHPPAADPSASPAAPK